MSMEVLAWRLVNQKDSFMADASILEGQRGWEGLPRDPLHPFYLTFCFACSSKAKPNQVKIHITEKQKCKVDRRQRVLSTLLQEFIRNYGGVVCFSCRAFFRRVYQVSGYMEGRAAMKVTDYSPLFVTPVFQKSSAPRLTCKMGGGCNVVIQHRRKCQKCRLDRCLATGMNRAAILTSEQKQQRFRKMLQKRQQRGPDTGLPDSQLTILKRSLTHSNCRAPWTFCGPGEAETDVLERSSGRFHWAPFSEAER